MGLAWNASQNRTSEPNARHSQALVLKYVKDAKAIPMAVCGQHIDLKKSCTHFVAKLYAQHMEGASGRNAQKLGAGIDHARKPVKSEK